jgi:hypothetical protein
MYYVNYDGYLYSATPRAGLQGRYIFPVIGPIYALSCFNLLRLFPGRRLRLAIALAAAFVFIALDFPYFLVHVTPEWFALSSG